MIVWLGGECNASVFVMQLSGELCNRAASKLIPVSVTAHHVPGMWISVNLGIDLLSSCVLCLGKSHNKLLLNYALSSTSTGIHVKCTFRSSNPAATCLAVVHKKILHLNSDGLRTIIASHTFKRSHNSKVVSGFINDLHLDDYQVGVVGVTLRQTVEPDGNVVLYVVINIGMCIICNNVYPLSQSIIL